MTAALTTFPDADVADLDRALRASLPLSYAASASVENADVALLAGTSDWPERAADRLRSGVAVVVVVDPRPTAPDGLEGRTDAAGTVILSEPYAAHPAMPAIAEALEGTDTIAVSSTAAVPARDQLFDLLRLVRSLEVTDLRSLDSLDNGASILLTLEGKRAGAPVLVRLSAASTTAGAPRVVVRAYGPGSVVSAVLPGPETARAATVTISTPDRTVTVATSPETAHRAVLRRVRKGADGSDLAAFAADVSLLENLLGSPA